MSRLKNYSGSKCSLVCSGVNVCVGLLVCVYQCELSVPRTQPKVCVRVSTNANCQCPGCSVSPWFSVFQCV